LSSAQELNLSGSDVQGDDVKWIVEALPMMPHLQAINMSKNTIETSTLDCLALALDAISGISTLNLSCANIKYLPLSFISSMSRIQTLVLEDNPLVFPPLETFSSGFLAVNEYLTSAKILNLNGLQLRSLDVVWIAQLLTSMPQIQELDISNNALNPSASFASAHAAVVKCAAGHSCVTHNYAYQHHSGYFCDICRSDISGAGVRCALCDYDVCSKCSVASPISSDTTEPVVVHWLISLASGIIYLEHLTHLNISSTGIKMSSSAKQKIDYGTDSLILGCSVVLSANYVPLSDASSGPLKPGDVGTLVQDDGSSKPYKVEFNGTTWWYAKQALVEHSMSDPSMSQPQFPVLIVGARVRRGPDWRWHNQDGARPGVVTKALDADGWVQVEWDGPNGVSGSRNSYRYSKKAGGFDLLPEPFDDPEKSD
jgi:hypothetical protein